MTGIFAINATRFQPKFLGNFGEISSYVPSFSTNKMTSTPPATNIPMTVAEFHANFFVLPNEIAIKIKMMAETMRRSPG